MRTILKRGLVVFGVLALSAGIAAMAFGPHGRGHGPGGPGERGPGHGLLGPRMAEELGLTEAQRDEIRGLIESRMEAGLAERMKGFGEARRGIHELMRDPDATEDQLLAAIEAVNTLEQQVLLERFRLGREVQALLTPEQQALAQELHEERAQRREDFRSRREARRGGGRLDG